MLKSWVYVEDFSDETSPAFDLEGWAEWLAETCPDGVDGPTREIKDGEVFTVWITDGHYLDATVKNGEITFTPELPDADTYGIADGQGMGWSEDDAFYHKADLERELIERAEDGGTDFVICACDGRKGEFTATFSRTPDGPVFQPDGWSL